MTKFQAVVLTGLLAVSVATVPVALKNHGRAKATPTERQKFEQAAKQVAFVATDRGSGSAVVIKRVNPQGKTRWFAWTAAHVVRDASEISIRLYIRADGHKIGVSVLRARLFNMDVQRDLALLSFEAPNDFFLNAEFASDEPTFPGQPIYGVGNFLGANFDNSASTGIISQLSVEPQFDGWPWLVVDQTTCPIFPGSSGGPLFNQNGEVIGLVVGCVSPVLNVFVPVRELTAFAAEGNFLWAVRGNQCPSDFVLTSKP